MKKQLPIIFILIIALSLATLIAIVDTTILDNGYSAELHVDFGISEGEIKHGATGFLYGLAEPDVPSGNLLYGISPQVLATRMPGGLQHPSGDIAQVEQTFFENGGQNVIIYMQDIYPDWYYAYREDYLDTMSDVLDSLIVLEYSDKFIYQPFNEMNNGVWYGDFALEENRMAFYEAYKNAYNLIKDKTGGAPVGGPAYTDYNSSNIREFLEYCIKNDCVPDVMIWHELIWYSTYGIRDNVADYRNIEKELGISERRIIIDEYGTFKDIGTPGNLIQYIASFEATKTEGCLAFWRLPNNMNDLAAENNMPTSAWWLYHWYSKMNGNTYQVSKSYKTIPYFSGVATADSEKATIICGGAEGKACIEIDSILSLDPFKEASAIKYEVEYLDFEGLTSPSLGGTKIISGTSKIKNGKAFIELDEISFSRAYRINVYPLSQAFGFNEITIHTTPARYEAEEQSNYIGTLLSNDDIRYASSSGGIKLSEGCSLTFDITVKEAGLYSLELVYAANPMIGGVRFNPRVDIIVDGTKENVYLPNTLTEHSSDQYAFLKYLSKGEHQITVRQDFGSLVIDFLDVIRVSDGFDCYKPIYQGIDINCSDTATEYMLVVDQSGYYSLLTNGDILSVNGIGINDEKAIFYLERGINFIVTTSSSNKLEARKITSKSTFYSIELAEGAFPYLIQNEHSPSGYYAKGVHSPNEIVFTINAENDGYYALTTVYSQADVSGTHSYNVKLVERYATIKINGEDYTTVYFANTYSSFNFAERTVYVYLKKGNNLISYYNNREHIWGNIKPIIPDIAGIYVNPLIK